MHAYLNYIKKLRDPRINNSFWVLSEKFVSLFGLVFIVSAVADYIGANLYGKMTFAAGVFIIIKTLSQFGMDQIYFNYVIKKRVNKSFLLNLAIKNITIAYFFLSILTIIFLYFMKIEGWVFIFAYCVASYFNAIDLYHFDNEANLNARYNTIALLIGLIISLLVRFFVVYYELDYTVLIVSILVFSILPVFIKRKIFISMVVKNKYIVKKNNHIRKYNSFILKKGGVLSVSIFLNALNLQLPIFFLGIMKDYHNLGQYSVAFVVAGMWCITPTTIILSFLPKIINNNLVYEKQIVDKTSKLFYSLLFLNLIICFCFFIAGPKFIGYFYGFNYIESIPLFKIILFGQFFWVFSYLLSRIVVRFGGNDFLLIRSILNIFLNIVLTIVFYNFWLCTRQK